MSFPPHGPPPPPYYGPPPPWPPPHHPPHHHHPPPHHHPHHHHPHYPPPPDGGQVTAQPHPYPYYYPGTMMIPVPMAPMPVLSGDSQATYITNYIYHGEGSSSGTNEVPAITETDKTEAVELSGEFDWVPTTATTASHLTGKAIVGGHEGWDGSPLWVIRAWHQGDLIPGKFSIRHNSASVVYDKKEVPVQNIEVLVANPESVRWIPGSNGNVPPGAIPGGRTSSGETLYIGRSRYQLSVTPGKVHPSHNCCYISFSGAEVSHKMYDVLCRIT